MPLSSVQAKKFAEGRKRDSRGYFIKEKVALSSPLDTKLIPEFEKPIISVNINNPLRKIMYWLDQIRKHQTTTLAFKLSIPLIVVPVIIAATFSVGRISGLGIASQNPAPVIYQSPKPQLPITISRAGILKIAKSQTQTQYVLSLKNGDIVILEVPTTIDLTKYANRQILVTGLFNRITNTLKVTDIAEITLYNTTIIPPEASASAK